MTSALRYIDLLKLSLIDLLGSSTSRAVAQADGDVRIEEVPEDERGERLVGRDWPAQGTTMIGLARLTNLQGCVETILKDDVPGDLIEAGVWRGGAAIFMRALLDLHDATERLVWAADSFAGLPPPDPATYPADEGDPHHEVGFLAVPLEQVRRNFSRYEIPTTGVRFVEGWFRDTLPRLRGHQWSLIRLDGDMYESTMIGLESLYSDISPGGFVVVDDYGAVPGCKRAVDDFREHNGIQDELEWIDWTGIMWRKGTPDKSQSSAQRPADTLSDDQRSGVLRERIAQLEQRLAVSDSQRVAVDEQLRTVRTHHERDVQSLHAQLAQTRDQLNQSESARQAAEYWLAEHRRSPSWRITEPLRAAKRLTTRRRSTS